MGGGSYSKQAYDSLRTTKRYDDPTVDRSQIFSQNNVYREMNPYNVRYRESRDSEATPKSLGVMIWLDVTGSMGMIPEDMVRNHMNTLMAGMMEKGVSGPQVFFGAIGDHRTDQAPLQIGQFENEVERLDKWLTHTWLEGGGGGNGGESYLVAYFFAANHTSLDCYEKRGEKGFLFTIGDEPTHRTISGTTLKAICGSKDEYQSEYSVTELLAKAREKYHVYHIHANDGNYPNDKNVISSWKELLGDNLIIVDNHKDIAAKIAEVVAKVSNSKVVTSTGKTVEVEDVM